MSIFHHFDRHVKNAHDNMDEAHRSILRAAQCHDEQHVTFILRKVVHNLAVACEDLDELTNVKRNPNKLPVDPPDGL